MTDLGAAETVDYTGDTVSEIRQRFPDGLDAVIDAVSSDAETFSAIAGWSGMAATWRRRAAPRGSRARSMASRC